MLFADACGGVFLFRAGRGIDFTLPEGFCGQNGESLRRGRIKSNRRVENDYEGQTKGASLWNNSEKAFAS